MNWKSLVVFLSKTVESISATSLQYLNGSRNKTQCRQCEGNEDYPKRGEEEEEKDDLIFFGDQSLYFCGHDISSRLHFQCSSIICSWEARTGFQTTP
jgi:hypothetical protein